MCTIKAPCHVKDLGTAVRIYYSYPEMSNKEIKELFGRNFSDSTLASYKSMIRQRQRELGVKTAIPHSVNTNVAFEVFGLDIASIERNYAKLKRLGMEN